MPTDDEHISMACTVHAGFWLAQREAILLSPSEHGPGSRTHWALRLWTVQSSGRCRERKQLERLYVRKREIQRSLVARKVSRCGGLGRKWERSLASVTVKASAMCFSEHNIARLDDLVSVILLDTHSSGHAARFS